MRPMARPEASALKKDFREYELAGQDIPETIVKFLTPGDLFDAQKFFHRPNRFDSRIIVPRSENILHLHQTYLITHL